MKRLKRRKNNISDLGVIQEISFPIHLLIILLLCRIIVIDILLNAFKMSVSFLGSKLDSDLEMVESTPYFGCMNCLSQR